MIKTILLDFGGILSDNVDSWNTMYKRIPEKTGLTIEELNEIFSKHWIEVSVGKKDFTDILDMFIKRSKNKITREDLLEIYSSDTKIYEDVLEIVTQLKNKGFMVIILSNESKVGEKIRLGKIEKFVDKIYSSSSIGIRKPDAQIFNYVLSKENLQSNETLFIDDRERNIIAAETLGIRGIVYKNIQQLKEDLEKYIH